MNAWDYEYLCDDCAEDAEDEAAIMEIVNSPRSGECAYDGEDDIWKFDPNKPFPQPQKSKATNRGVWMPPEQDDISAEAKWNKIHISDQKKLINNVFCVKCKLTRIVDFTVEDSSIDIVLRGKCAKCGGKVARVIECDWFDKK